MMRHFLLNEEGRMVPATTFRLLSVDTELVESGNYGFDTFVAEARITELERQRDRILLREWEGASRLSLECDTEKARADAAEKRIAAIVAEVKRRHIIFPQVNLDELADDIESGRL